MALVIQNQEHFDEVVAFAEEIGLRDQLDQQLEFLDKFAENGERGATRCYLDRDFAPYSFFFNLEKRVGEGEYRTWFVGGLIFHGPHDNGGDGGYPTLAVSVDPSVGWQIHT